MSSSSSARIVATSLSCSSVSCSKSAGEDFLGAGGLECGAVRFGRGWGGWGRACWYPSEPSIYVTVLLPFRASINSLARSSPGPRGPPRFSSLTRSAYRRVLRVCSQLPAEGDTQAIISVRQFPRKLSFSTCVSLDPRKGVCLLSWSSARMHSFSASKDLFISAPSNLTSLYLVCLSESVTSAPLSLPAKSIKDIFPRVFVPSFISISSTP